LLPGLLSWEPETSNPLHHPMLCLQQDANENGFVHVACLQHVHADCRKLYCPPVRYEHLA